MNKAVRQALLLTFLLSTAHPHALARTTEGGSNVHGSTGEDAWAGRINLIALPKAQQAASAFEAFAKAEMQVVLRQKPQYFFASTEEEAARLKKKHPKAHVNLLLRSMSWPTLIEFSAGDVIRGHVRALHAQATKDKEARIPQWLRLGTKSLLAYRFLNEVGYGPASEKELFKAQQEIRLLGERAANPGALFSSSHLPMQVQGFRSVATLMVHDLQERVGSSFWRRYGVYLQSVSKPDFKHDRAFEVSFALSPVDFLRRLETRLLALQEEKRQHLQPIPAASGYASLDDVQRFPLTSKADRDFFKKYISARSPKALALSLRGYAAYSADDGKAIEHALEECRQLDGMSCQLYAVDNAVVYEPQQANTGTVETIWASPDEPRWNQEVKQQWLPLVQKAVAAYNTTMLSKIGAGIDLNLSLFVTADRRDYEQVLRDKLRFPKELAASAAYGRNEGYSNARGATAIVLREQWSSYPETMRRTAVLTALHEVTHDLQAQLSGGAHSRSPVWLLEGSADFFATSVGQTLGLEDAPELTMERLRLTGVARYISSARKATPEQLWTTDYLAWQEMTNRGLGNYEIASLMVLHLADMSGEKFYRNWVTYYQGLGNHSKSPDKLFEECFGISKAAFLASFNDSVKKLKPWQAAGSQNPN